MTGNREQRDRALRVLVIEDDTGTRNRLARVAKHGGHELRRAAHGADALGMAEERHPDVVLIDMSLPDQENCCAAVAFGSPRRTCAPMLVALADQFTDGDRRRWHRAGFHFLLRKPLDLHLAGLLLNAAQDLLKPGKKESESSSAQ